MEADVSGSLHKCVKCSNSGTIAGCEGKNVAYCNDCYREMVTHKFRSALGKRRVFKDGASKAALVVSFGDAASVFLLRQIDEAINLDPHKRLLMEPTVVTVMSSCCERVRSCLPPSTSRAVHVAAVLRPEGRVTEGEETAEEVKAYSQLLQSVATSTGKEELGRILRDRLILRISGELDLHTVLLPDSADSLARLSLHSLCIGRGAQISEMTSAVEKRKGLPTLVRPLKEVREKEIAMGNRLGGWEGDVVYVVGEDRREHEKGSVQHATDEFIATLHQEGFAATVSTVLSTAGKIHADVAVSTPICRLCLRQYNREVVSLCAPCASIVDEIPSHLAYSIQHLITT